MDLVNRYGQPLSVLVAGGEPVVRHRLVGALGGIGLTTYEAADGKETVDVVCSLRIDGLVLDNDLPDIGGLETIRVIRTFHRVPPYLLLASALTRGLQAAALDWQATSVLPKPVDEDLLSDIVRAMLVRAYGRAF
jgi:CheY-like chemotaxis protein